MKRQDRVPNKAAHAANLPLPAFVNGYTHIACGAVRIDEIDLRGKCHPVIEKDSFAQSRYLGFADDAVYMGFIRLIDVLARMQKAIAKLAVGREQENPRRVEVEPSNWKQPGISVAWNEIRHRRTVESVSDIVVRYPAGLCSISVTGSSERRTVLPSTVTTSTEGSTLLPSSRTTSPFTRTLPAVMRSSLPPAARDAGTCKKLLQAHRNDALLFFVRHFRHHSSVVFADS